MREKILIKNKKAVRNYNLLEEFEAGVVLSGDEVKAIRLGKVDFLGSYVKVIGNELFLINFHIGAKSLLDTRKARKLLVKRSEIISLGSKMKQQKLTLMPIKLYNKGRLIKLKVALVKPKRKHEKRTFLRNRDIEREVQRELEDMGTS